MLAMKQTANFFRKVPSAVDSNLILKLAFGTGLALVVAIAANRFGFSNFQILSLMIAALMLGYLVPRSFAFAPNSEKTVSQQPPQTSLTALDVLHVFPNPGIIFDAQGLAMIVNPAAKQAFRGLDTGIGFNQWFRDTAMLNAFGTVKSTGKPMSIELLEKRPLERVFRVEIAAIDSARNAILMVFLEHTEALRVDRMRADFIANASHELRTPLTAVTGFLETLQGPARNDVINRDRFIVLMLEQTQRMARLIDDLLSLSRFETQSAPSKLQKVDLGLLAGTTVDALAGLASANDVKIENQLEPDTVTVDGDPDELTQVLQNLIENAVKYGASGGRIEVGLTKPNLREHGFFVRDFGAGIPSEHIPRLTERFYRVDIEASRQQKGTGLGLAIVKHILSRHRARLVIESRQGEGSTFTVLFPSVV